MEDSYPGERILRRRLKELSPLGVACTVCRNENSENGEMETTEAEARGEKGETYWTGVWRPDSWGPELPLRDQDTNDFFSR